MAPSIFAPSLVEADLNKLTVKELRLLCKERRLSGYSKPPKAVLISMLLDWQYLNSAVTTKPTQVSLPKDNSESPALVQGVTLLPQPLSLRTSADLDVIQPAISNVSGVSVSQTPVIASGSARLCDDPPTSRPLARRKGSLELDDTESEISLISSKRPCNDTEASTKTAENKKARLSNKWTPLAEASDTPSIHRLSRVSLQSVSGTNARGGRHFRTLVPKLQATQASTEAQSNIQLLDTPPPGHFDVEQSIPQLLPISLPPLVAQRKHVPRLSLLLSKISAQDMKSCVLVSRLFRYCAYSAAYNQLLRYFQGSRLKSVLSQYQSKVTNFWPYLIYRMDEAVKRKKEYEASFVGCTMKDMYSINENIWNSPDNHKQALIGIRFLLTQLFFIVSLGHGFDRTKSEADYCRKIIRVDEVVVGEIWKITVQASSSIFEYHVVEATCEVIGRPTEGGISHSLDTHRLRLDWESYIKSRSLCTPTFITSGQVIPLGLLGYLHWTNHEEYDKGISKLWLSKIQKEGNIGMVKLTVAQRYIIACVVSNSISGPQLTANQMLHEYNGIPPISTNIGMVPKNQRIRLFLPAHHHLESLDFDSSNRKPLHDALAIVQTPARQYYILKDNGMQVGSEEDGVAYVWMRVLSCKNDGSV